MKQLISSECFKGSSISNGFALGSKDPLLMVPVLVVGLKKAFRIYNSLLEKLLFNQM